MLHSLHTQPVGAEYVHMYLIVDKEQYGHVDQDPLHGGNGRSAPDSEGCMEHDCKQ